jgi:hypothetical protein
MAAGYDIGASASASSGVQAGSLNAGDFIVGGSGGASKQQIPTSIIVAAIIIVVVGVLAWMFKK